MFLILLYNTHMTRKPRPSEEIEYPVDFNPTSQDPADWERWLKATDGILPDEALESVGSVTKKRVRRVTLGCDGVGLDDAVYEDPKAFEGHDPVVVSFLVMEDRLSHMKYIASPESMEGLLEAVIGAIGNLEQDGTPKANIRIGCHGSCQTRDLMITVYERGGLQYHIDTKDIPVFELGTFKLLLADELGVNIEDLDHYVSDI